MICLNNIFQIEKLNFNVDKTHIIVDENFISISPFIRIKCVPLLYTLKNFIKFWVIMSQKI